MPGTLIPLWEDSVPGFDTASPTHCPTLKPYLLPGPGPHATVIVFPGGGYNVKAPHEADPIAVWLNSVGLSAFVLDYRVSPYQHPYPMLDGLRAVRLVRSQAESFNIRSDQIAILGFSAGGHLASTVSTLWDTGNPQAEDAVDRFSARPNAQILCYPVISFLSHQHAGSMETLLGKSASEELRRSLSAEQQVTPETPPTFLFHTANDASVPVENSLLFAKVLSHYDVPFELHIFQDGAHGVGLAEGDPFLSIWTDLCVRWFRKIGFLPI